MISVSFMTGTIPFQIILAIHILSGVVLVGNLITSAFWKVRADQTSNLETISSTCRGLARADCMFTIPGIVVLLATGILLVALTGWQRFEQFWLGLSFLLLIVTIVIWFAALLPLQRRMVRLSQEGLARGELDPAYARTSRRWSMVGGIATLLVVIILFLMVLRP